MGRPLPCPLLCAAAAVEPFPAFERAGIALDAPLVAAMSVLPPVTPPGRLRPGDSRSREGTGGANGYDARANCPFRVARSRVSETPLRGGQNVSRCPCHSAWS